MKNIKKLDWFFGGGSSFIEPIPPDANVLFDFTFWQLSTMFQERSILPGGVPVTAVTTQTNSVGTIFDMSRACKFLRATGSTAIPTLGSNGVLFDANDALEMVTSTTYLKRLHAVGATYSVRFKLLKGIDGSAGIIVGTQGLSSTHHGIVFNQTAANKLQFFASGGTGQTIVNYTSTKSILIADGVITVHLVIKAGSGASFIRINGTTETFTADLTKGSTSNCTNSLTIGGIGTFFRGQIVESLTCKVDYEWTSSEMAAYEALTTSRTTVDFPIIKQWQLDFWNPAKNFSDAGGTTQVTNGSVTRLTRSSLSIPADTASGINRDATSASDAAAALWASNADGNGNGGTTWPGDGTKLLTYGEDICLEAGGTSTEIIVFKNTDLTFGTHLKAASPNYLVITGINYTNPLKPYVVAHNSFTTGPLVSTSQSGVDIIAIQRRGNYAIIWNRAGGFVVKSNYGLCNNPTFGQSTQGADWYGDGAYLLHEKYMGWIPNMPAKLAALRTQFNISSSLS